MHNQHKHIGSFQSQKFYYSPKDPPLFFVMMRFNVKVALIFLTSVAIFTILVFYSICGQIQPNKKWSKANINNKVFDIQGSEEIHCVINGESAIACIKEGDEVYIPFSFIHKYFEINGKVVLHDGSERFEWSHSYSKIYHPKSNKYNPREVFMYFENYNVEARERVKCVSAIDGVPVSIQWESQGYYYPTQIAQFGLSHYSKNLTEPEPQRRVIENCETELANWIVPYTASIERELDPIVGSRILKFRTGDGWLDGIKLQLDQVSNLVMSLNIMLNGNSSISVILQNRETTELYNLHYITSDIHITVQGNNLYHGIGSLSEWKKLTRDLVIDLQKGLSLLGKDRSKHRIPRSKVKIINITLRGSGALDNLTLATSEHIQQFYDAANWFVKHQDPETGGWPIPVKRKLASGFHDLQPDSGKDAGQKGCRLLSLNPAVVVLIK